MCARRKPSFVAALLAVLVGCWSLTATQCDIFGVRVSVLCVCARAEECIERIVLSVT